MKKVRYVLSAVLGFIALSGVVRADPATELESPEDAPTIHYDPDGIPLAVTEKQPVKATPEQIAAYRKEQAKAAADKDWLLRAYEKQLQTRESKSSSATEYQNANPYEEISANKDLAKLAGLPDFNDDGSLEKPLPRTGNEQGDHSSATLHPGSAPIATGYQPFGSAFLKPMITPLSSPQSAGLNNFYSSLPVAGGPTSFYSNSQPAPVLHSRVSIIPDETADHDIDTPGMIAAEKNPLADPSTSDLTLDVLPGESIEHAKSHQDNNDSLLQLPMAMNADQYHRAQAAELTPQAPKSSAPNGANANVANAPTTPTKPADDYDVPVPASKLPVITPVRAPIANPYDILNR